MKKEKKSSHYQQKKIPDSEIYWLILLCLWEEAKGLLLGLFQSSLTKHKRLLLQGVTLKQQADYLDVPKVWTTFSISRFCSFQMVFCKVLSETV